MKQLIVTAALTLFPATSALAQEFALNGSFESPPLPVGTTGQFTSIPGWSADPGKLLRVRNECCGVAHAGNQFLEFDGEADRINAISETVTTTFGTSFLLSVAYAPRPGHADNRIDVVWDGTVVATLDRDGTVESKLNWRTESFVVEATGPATTLRFEDRDGGAGGYLDRVSVLPRLGFHLYSVLPSMGSSYGSELVHLSGMGFTTPEDTAVTFGGAAATVLSVTSERIDVLTPPGTGTVDVVLANSAGTASFLTAYAYVAPDVAARFGNVNLGRGDREKVLFVNRSPGDLVGETTVGVGEPLSIFMQVPSSRSAARFAFYAWLGAPLPGTIRTQPAGLGTSVFPTPLNAGDGPQPRAIANNWDPRLGVASFPAAPAPSFVLERGRGVPAPLVVTFQGIIQDNGSRLPQRASLTNAVIVRFE